MEQQRKAEDQRKLGDLSQQKATGPQVRVPQPTQRLQGVTASLADIARKRGEERDGSGGLGDCKRKVKAGGSRGYAFPEEEEEDE